MIRAEKKPPVLISKATVDDAKPGERDQFIWDRKIPGFGLKVTPAGGKVYVFQYRIARPGEAERTAASRYTIGKHGKLTADQARTEAKRLAALVEQGTDPRELEAEKLAAKDEAARQAREREQLATELAFDRMADKWLQQYKLKEGKPRSPSSLRMAKLVVDGHLKPAFGNQPLPSITRKDVKKVIDQVSIEKIAMKRAIFAYASALISWAVDEEVIAENPLLTGKRPEAPAARDRWLTDDELASVWKATTALGKPFEPFFKLLILTGQRRSEVAGIGWDELDRATATWMLPAARAKNDTAQLVPLSAAAMQELDKMAGGDKWPKTGLVFTRTGETPISGFSKAKTALDAAIAEQREGVPLPDWRIHDLRRTLATGLQRLGVRFEVTEAVLNHVSGSKGGVAGVYQKHNWIEEKRSALDAWARHVGEILAPADRGNVVVLTAAKGVAA